MHKYNRTFSIQVSNIAPRYFSETIQQNMKENIYFFEKYEQFTSYERIYQILFSPYVILHITLHWFLLLKTEVLHVKYHILTEIFDSYIRLHNQFKIQVRPDSFKKASCELPSFHRTAENVILRKKCQSGSLHWWGIFPTFYAVWTTKE